MLFCNHLHHLSASVYSGLCRLGKFGKVALFLMRPMTMRRFVPVMLVALGVAAAAGEESDAKLDRFFKRYLEESFQLRPMQATLLGDHRFDNLLDDLSPSARRGWV